MRKAGLVGQKTLDFTGHLGFALLELAVAKPRAVVSRTLP